MQIVQLSNTKDKYCLAVVPDGVMVHSDHQAIRFLESFLLALFAHHYVALGHTPEFYYVVTE